MASQSEVTYWPSPVQFQCSLNTVCRMYGSAHVGIPFIALYEHMIELVGTSKCQSVQSIVRSIGVV